MKILKAVKMKDPRSKYQMMQKTLKFSAGKKSMSYLDLAKIEKDM